MLGTWTLRVYVGLYINTSTDLYMHMIWYNYLYHFEVSRRSMVLLPSREPAAYASGLLGFPGRHFEVRYS